MFQDKKLTEIINIFNISQYIHINFIGGSFNSTKFAQFNKIFSLE